MCAVRVRQNPRLKCNHRTFYSMLTPVYYDFCRCKIQYLRLTTFKCFDKSHFFNEISSVKVRRNSIEKQLIL